MYGNMNRGMGGMGGRMGGYNVGGGGGPDRGRGMPSGFNGGMGTGMAAPGGPMGGMTGGMLNQAGGGGGEIGPAMGPGMGMGQMGPSTMGPVNMMGASQGSLAASMNIPLTPAALAAGLHLTGEDAKASSLGLDLAKIAREASAAAPPMDEGCCGEHGKKRTSKALEWDEKRGMMVCKPGMTCKGSGGAPTMREGGAAVLSANEAVCSIHGRRRGIRFMQANGDGTYSCTAGSECKVGYQGGMQPSRIEEPVSNIGPQLGPNGQKF